MDLRSGIPFWAVQSGTLGVYPPLVGDVECDVAVVGGGITGALVAHRLASLGWRCVVLDKRDVGWGSTMASTALLQYELDVPLRELAKTIGLEDAGAAYRLCAQGVGSLARLAGSLDDTCGLWLCRSLYLANGADELEGFALECELRRAVGIDARLLDGDQVRERYGIERPGAIVSALGARVEPFRLTHRLLADVQRRGSRVFDRTAVVGLVPAGAGGMGGNGGQWRLVTDRGPRVTAERVVFATGYESQAILREKMIEMVTTFAAATEPAGGPELPGGGPPAWLNDHVVWESGDPYFYMRSGPDGRLLVGGEDVPYESVAANQRQLARKTDDLADKARRLLPRVPVEVAYAWSGVFGKTRDGLGYFGQSPELPGIDFVLGFGGNGITLSAVMAGMLAERYAGREPEGARLFRFGR